MSGYKQENDEGQGPIISAFGVDEDLKEVVSFFVQELETHMGSLRRALEISDIDVLTSVSQYLKGAAGGYGFHEIRNYAAAVEQAALSDEADVNEVRERAEALIQLCSRAVA